MPKLISICFIVVHKSEEILHLDTTHTPPKFKTMPLLHPLKFIPGCFFPTKEHKPLVCSWNWDDQ